MPTRNQSIAMAIISLVGSLGVAAITSHVTTNSTIDDRAKDLRAIHLESGSQDFDSEQMKANHMDKPPNGVPVTVSYTPRIIRQHIQFDKQFDFTPVVRTGLQSLDVGNEAHIRILVSADNVTTAGFDLRVQTWSDSRIYFVATDWFAYEQ
jgi:hypothetical protein